MTTAPAELPKGASNDLAPTLEEMSSDDVTFNCCNKVVSAGLVAGRGTCLPPGCQFDTAGDLCGGPAELDVPWRRKSEFPHSRRQIFALELERSVRQQRQMARGPSSRIILTSAGTSREASA